MARASRAQRVRRTRTRPNRRDQRLSFAAIEIVGGLLTPDVFNRIATPSGDAETRRGYGIPEGLDLRDEIARAYRMAEAQWTAFDAARDSDAGLPERFVPQFLGAIFGFDDLVPAGPVLKGERAFPIGHVARAGRVPVVIAPVPGEDQRRSGLDTLHQTFADGNRRRSATLLLQEFLNAQEDCLWGIATDGLTLRLLRDNLSLTRPAWIEVDLAKVFRDGLYADFSAVWLLIHASRFGPADAAPSDSALEHWREQGQQDGVAARHMLGGGVKAALSLLGQGAIEHPANAALREALANGTLTAQRLYEELLGAVYRLIFLFAAEDRDLLHPPGTAAAQCAAYARGYGVGRLRERAMRRASWDRHHDAWDGLRAVFRALGTGAPALGLPALGGLFGPGRTPYLDQARIGNRFVMKAIFHLAWLRPQGRPLSRVNWRDMRTEELGSVYEGLLELIPEASAEARRFAFRETSGGAGSERKSTGSYYTPDALVKLVLDTTLDPLLDQAQAGGEDPVSAILDLNILDPACGSGHFLLGAAHRAAARIANLRSPGAPGRDDYQHALREVISHMIYGVDRNPLAVELCKVALWIDALEPGKPLSFLDARIRCGDSLIGVLNYRMLRDGLPDEAFDPLTGDDKNVAKAYKDINKEQRDGPTATCLIEDLRAPATIADEANRVFSMPENTPREIQAKSWAWDRLLNDPEWLSLRDACDMYVAAFLLLKIGGIPDPQLATSHELPTTETIWKAARGADVRRDIQEKCIKAAKEINAFHWPLEFPAIMARGGFDAVLGNPPWERIKLLEQEFFAARDAEIATAATKDERNRLIKALKKAEPGTPQSRLSAEFELAKHASEAASVFVRKSGRFPLTGTGDVNTYALFAEHFDLLARVLGTSDAVDGDSHEIADVVIAHPPSLGRAGIVLPMGIATDSSTSAFFSDLVRKQRLAFLYSFYEVRKWFTETDERKPFCIFVIGENRHAIPVVVNIENIDDIYKEERQVFLEIEDFLRYNPNTLTAPLFRTRSDQELTRQLYGSASILIRKRNGDPEGDVNAWGISFQTLFHMSNDSGYFRTAKQLRAQDFFRDGPDWRHPDGRCYVPLLEAKMIHHFDHRFGSFEGLEKRPGDGSLPEAPDVLKANDDYEPQPWNWVPAEENRFRMARMPVRLKRYYRKKNANGCRKVLAEWVLGTLDPEDLNPAHLARSADRAFARLRDILGVRALERDVLGARIATWLGKVAHRAREMQRETALSEEDLTFIKRSPSDPVELTGALIDRKQPRWLVGFRDITNAASERTVIGCVFPSVAVGNNLPLWHPDSHLDPKLISALVVALSSITLDYAARQKIAGTHLNYFYAEQLPVLSPNRFSCDDLDFITSRVLELTYTSHAMHPWAQDLGHSGPPFDWDHDRRIQLRAELDAFIARKYSLTRDQLRYILDPTDVHGADYPSETFRVLRENEIARFGEYRTRRLVLEAYDRLERVV